MSDTTPIRTGRQSQPANEERLEILRMVESGTITPEEASRLLDALSDGDRGPAASVAPQRRRHLRIRVSDSGTGKAKVNLVLPFGLVDAGLGIAKRLAPDRLAETGAIRDALASGGTGTLLDVDENGERVEIIVE
jgi:hypothetical protein